MNVREISNGPIPSFLSPRNKKTRSEFVQEKINQILQERVRRDTESSDREAVSVKAEENEKVKEVVTPILTPSKMEQGSLFMSPSIVSVKSPSSQLRLSAAQKIKELRERNRGIVSSTAESIVDSKVQELLKKQESLLKEHGLYSLTKEMISEKHNRVLNKDCRLLTESKSLRKGIKELFSQFDSIKMFIEDLELFLGVIDEKDSEEYDLIFGVPGQDEENNELDQCIVDILELLKLDQIDESSSYFLDSSENDKNKASTLSFSPGFILSPSECNSQDDAEPVSIEDIFNKIVNQKIKEKLSLDGLRRLTQLEGSRFSEKELNKLQSQLVDERQELENQLDELNASINDYNISLLDYKEILNEWESLLPLKLNLETKVQELRDIIAAILNKDTSLLENQKEKLRDITNNCELFIQYCTNNKISSSSSSSSSAESIPDEFEGQVLISSSGDQFYQEGLSPKLLADVNKKGFSPFRSPLIAHNERLRNMQESQSSLAASHSNYRRRLND